MTDLRREIHLLVTVAKLDAALNASRIEAGQLPGKIRVIEKELAAIEKAVAEADAHLEGMKKERRGLEQTLQDSEEKVKKLKTQLMEIKTNKEYQAMLHEIDHMKRMIDESEERLLIVMDELDQQGAQTGDFKTTKDDEKKRLTREKSELEARLERLKTEMTQLDAERPKILIELDPQVRKRYDRILAKLQDFAVTRVVGETCQGCHALIPPQRVLEVKKNDQIIACQGCGRILVHYEA